MLKDFIFYFKNTFSNIRKYDIIFSNDLFYKVNFIYFYGLLIVVRNMVYLPGYF